MTDDRPSESGNKPVPVQVSGAVRLVAALIIALLALGITLLAARWLPEGLVR